MQNLLESFQFEAKEVHTESVKQNCSHCETDADDQTYPVSEESHALKQTFSGCRGLREVNDKSNCEIEECLHHEPQNRLSKLSTFDELGQVPLQRSILDPWNQQQCKPNQSSNHYVIKDKEFDSAQVAERLRAIVPHTFETIAEGRRR